MAILLTLVLLGAKAVFSVVSSLRNFRFSAYVLLIMASCLVLSGCGDDEGSTIVIVDGDLTDEQRRDFCKDESRTLVDLPDNQEVIFTKNPKSPCGVELENQTMELHLHSNNATSSFLVNDFGLISFSSGFESLIVDVEGVEDNLFVRPGQSCTVVVEETREGNSESFYNTGSTCNLFMFRTDRPSIEFTLTKRSN